MMNMNNIVNLLYIYNSLNRPENHGFPQEIKNWFWNRSTS